MEANYTRIKTPQLSDLKTISDFLYNNPLAAVTLQQTRRQSPQLPPASSISKY
ncbi:hypothetical protein FH972_027031 [Carpinus fangiana]|uniref:Uncharacterized protein n=1 Tax=Carpinus fangiana TaxID=176857 RepID=A0A5N6L5S1_9ROSI|nr:hypothetical protein FH972_027031 [Carpinus fangiana]